MDTSKLNNYHFGRHVFEYFPWYKYNTDIKTIPTLDDNIRLIFNFAFDKESDAANMGWCESLSGINQDVYFFCNIERYGSKSMVVENGLAICGIKETVFDWEDIEKIRLRHILGKKEDAERYMSYIDLYTNYHDLISDIVYSEAGEDIELRIVNIEDFILRDNNDVCVEFLEESDIYKLIDKKLLTFNDVGRSVTSYYKKNGTLPQYLIDGVRNNLKSTYIPKSCKDLYSGIYQAKPMAFIYIKTNRIKNINRVMDYISEIGLKYKKFDDFLLAYK